MSYQIVVVKHMKQKVNSKLISLHCIPKLKWISLPLALDGNVTPSGLKKSSSGLSFQVPRRPLVEFLKAAGRASTMDSDSFTSDIVTDIPDGKTTMIQLFCGRDNATEPFKFTLMFVSLLNSWKCFPSTNTSSPPATNTETHVTILNVMQIVHLKEFPDSFFSLLLLLLFLLLSWFTFFFTFSFHCFFAFNICRLFYLFIFFVLIIFIWALYDGKRSGKLIIL